MQGLGGVLTLQPRPGDGSPEISWGDSFLYYAPDGVVPRTQPFATIVTGDQPGDRSSRLDRPHAFRLNIAAGAAEFSRITGSAPREPAVPVVDPSAVDVLFPHPVYGELGWLSVVEPGPRTDPTARELLRAAHRHARGRHERRAEAGSAG